MADTRRKYQVWILTTRQGPEWTMIGFFDTPNEAREAIKEHEGIWLRDWQIVKVKTLIP